MNSVFLSPHNDDETLFGAFTLLRESPHVVVCFRSYLQEKRGCTWRPDLGRVEMITALQRELETAAAMQILGCDWEQLELPDSSTPDDASVFLRAEVDRLADEFEHCYAPWPDTPLNGSHWQHDMLGTMALEAFGRSRVTLYGTYDRHGGKHPPFAQTWQPVLIQDPSWTTLKLRALACYESQHQDLSTREHFWRDLLEWYAP